MGISRPELPRLNPPRTLPLPLAWRITATLRLRSILHLLAAQLAHQGKACDDFLWAGEREEWVAVSGATFHGTGSPHSMVDCIPPPPR